ncbi:hypothetical protein AB0E01_22880 [Nocardia vinacea]|uniref:hypothetical protein n=1 Tax=Nocardia vinacea TaxID=96468 RepID=UPI0033DB1B85
MPTHNTYSNEIKETALQMLREAAEENPARSRSAITEQVAADFTGGPSAATLSNWGVAAGIFPDSPPKQPSKPAAKQPKAKREPAPASVSEAHADQAEKNELVNTVAKLTSENAALREEVTALKFRNAELNGALTEARNAFQMAMERR